VCSYLLHPQENSNVLFTDQYPGGSENKQNFNDCVKVTHATSMGYSHGWHANNYQGINGTELQRAQYATSRMGYSFEIDTVSVALNVNSKYAIDMDVMLKQVGVAPFYFPLFLSIYCSSTQQLLSTKKVATSELVGTNSKSKDQFFRINATEYCLTNGGIEFKLESPKLYPNRPIKWAQGTNNGRVILPIPYAGPSSAPVVPTSQPYVAPTNIPVTTKPTFKPKRKFPTRLVKPDKRPSQFQ
jgi:hypothetical protein